MTIVAICGCLQWPYCCSSLKDLSLWTVMDLTNDWEVNLVCEIPLILSFLIFRVCGNNKDRTSNQNLFASKKSPNIMPIFSVHNDDRLRGRVWWVHGEEWAVWHKRVRRIDELLLQGDVRTRMHAFHHHNDDKTWVCKESGRKLYFLICRYYSTMHNYSLCWCDSRLCGQIWTLRNGWIQGTYIRGFSCKKRTFLLDLVCSIAEKRAASVDQFTRLVTVSLFLNRQLRIHWPWETTVVFILWTR